MNKFIYKLMVFASLSMTLHVAITSQKAMAASHGKHKESFEISEAWARDTLGRTMSGAAYMTIKNIGHQADRLISVRSDAARKVEIHLSQSKDGMMTMTPVYDGIKIAKGDTLKLKPMSYHVMFMGLTKAFVKGEVFPITLTFEKAGEVIVYIEVRSISGEK